MNDKAFQKFLATGEYVPTMDSAENPGAEFGENWKGVESGNPLRKEISDVIVACQLQPDERLRSDSLSLGGLFVSNDADAEPGTPEMNPHYIVELHGGTNGSPDKRVTLAYLAVVRKFAKMMLDEKVAEKIWLIDWKNDCADDVWTARLAFKTPDQEKKEIAPEQ